MDDNYQDEAQSLTLQHIERAIEQLRATPTGFRALERLGRCLDDLNIGLSLELSDVDAHALRLLFAAALGDFPNSTRKMIRQVTGN